MEEDKENLQQSDDQPTVPASPTDWEQKLASHEKTASERTDEPQTQPLPASESEVFASHFPLSQPQPQPKGPGGFWFFLLLLAFCMAVFCGVYLSVKPGVSCPAKAAAGGKSFSLATGKKSSGAGLAWIKVRGVISEEDSQSPFSRPSGASYISKRIREAAKDKAVKAIVLDINSPGGTVASVQDIYSEILNAKKQGKKVVALFRDVAASGAFYIAMAADKIVAEPGTITGSVGVIMQAGNVVGLFNKLGIEVTPITSGKYKDIGSAYRPMTDAEKALLQDMVDDTYSQFFAAVKAGRPQVKEEVLAEYTDGRVFTGQRAYNLGFVDKLGGEETARLLAGELAGLKDPKVLSPKSEGLRELIFSFGSGLESKSLTKQLQSMQSPSVSYLWVY